MKNKELDSHWTSERIDPARWSLGDIHGKACDMGIEESKITEEFCKDVASQLQKCFDAEIGINWLVIENAINECINEDVWPNQSKGISAMAGDTYEGE